MENKKTTILVFALLIIAAALYRVWDHRPWGFAPQIAMALFAGSVIKDKKFAFLVPLFSMLISDSLYQVLYSQGLTEIRGFYEGQWVNYILFTAVTAIVAFATRINPLWLFAAGGILGLSGWL